MLIPFFQFCCHTHVEEKTSHFRAHISQERSTLGIPKSIVSHSKYEQALIPFIQFLPVLLAPLPLLVLSVFHRGRGHADVVEEVTHGVHQGSHTLPEFVVGSSFSSVPSLCSLNTSSKVLVRLKIFSYVNTWEGGRGGGEGGGRGGGQTKGKGLRFK